MCAIFEQTRHCELTGTYFDNNNYISVQPYKVNSFRIFISEHQNNIAIFDRWAVIFIFIATDLPDCILLFFQLTERKISIKNRIL